MTQRGRPRKHKWLTLEQLTNKQTPHAQYLKWASTNNIFLQTIAAIGCPKCKSRNIELRHDKIHKIIRLHCIQCRHETSCRIKTPKPDSYQAIPLILNGVQLDQAIIDRYHSATKRQRIDAIVLKISRNIEKGRINLGGEWYVDNTAKGLHQQKRYFISFEEVKLVCDWNKMQAEHEKRLRQLENDAKA